MQYRHYRTLTGTRFLLEDLKRSFALGERKILTLKQCAASVYAKSSSVKYVRRFFSGHFTQTGPDRTAWCYGKRAAARLLEPIKIQRLFFLLSLTRP